MKIFDSMKKFIMEASVIVLTVILAVGVMDYCGTFVFDDPNNHNEKRWNHLYAITEKNDIDILILGNSHAYTGILPKQLSCNLGRTCFVLASGGTYSTDAYHMLKEALTRTTPEVVVIETYMMREHKQKELKKGDLSDQIKSFDARKSIGKKLLSTPQLFDWEVAPYAWSTTLRNHNFIFDGQQMKKCLKKVKHPAERLYLGRYIRFNSGLTQKTLDRYAADGAPVEGKDMKVGKEAAESVEDILRLCDRKGIKVMFLTLPMYKDHVADYDIWKGYMSEVIGDRAWLDLQNDPYFGPESFEDTYKDNQHMTYTGALKANDRLTSFIRNEFPELKPRYGDRKWVNMFYAEDGFYENMSPPANDKKARVYARNQVSKEGLGVIELLSCIGYNGTEQFICKVSRKSTGDNPPTEMKIVAGIADQNGKKSTVMVPLRLSPGFGHLDYHVYTARMRRGTRILSAAMMDNR